jgi:hypothetical protein
MFPPPAAPSARPPSGLPAGQPPSELLFHIDEAPEHLQEQMRQLRDHLARLRNMPRAEEEDLVSGGGER